MNIERFLVGVEQRAAELPEIDRAPARVTRYLKEKAADEDDQTT